MAWVILAICVVAAALLLVAYFKGKKDEQAEAFARDIDRYIKEQERQEEREASHDKRVDCILSGDISADDAGRMLSTWSDTQKGSSKT